MRRLINLVARLFADRKHRYLIGGGFNTVVNYVVGAAIYQTLLPRLNFFVVAVIATIVSISISFTTHKIFVFRTKGKWWVEYLRSYVVYGSSAVLNVGFLWVLLHRAHMNVWLAQAIVTAVAIVISYIGHTVFTFKQTKLPGAKSAAH